MDARRLFIAKVLWMFDRVKLPGQKCRLGRNVSKLRLFDQSDTESEFSAGDERRERVRFQTSGPARRE